jgi:hypothetical protein
LAHLYFHPTLQFEDVDVSEEWTEYCEKLGESISIFGVQGKFVAWRAGKTLKDVIGK